MNKTIIGVVGLLMGAGLTLGGMQLLPKAPVLEEQPEDRNTEVINSVTRLEEVALLSLGIQGIAEQNNRSTVFGLDVPGSSRATFIQYNFDAKLGIDGGSVSIEEIGEGGYLISIPAFLFIGHSDESFRLVAENNGVLSWITPETDSVEMINQILSDEAQQEYIDDNRELLMDQAETFYCGIIHGVEPDAKLRFVFSETR